MDQDDEELLQSVQEAISSLDQHRLGKLEKLSKNEYLEMATVDHYKDIAPKGLCSHTGSDESSYKDRIERYASWGGAIYEAIRYMSKPPKFTPVGSENYE